MSGSLPPSGAINDLRTAAHGLLAERLAALDLTKLFVYIIKNAPDTALPLLAWQFDVLSPFWQLLSPGLSQQQLIEQAIPLHSRLGTPYALKTSITNLGWPSPNVQEGQASWGGSSYPDDQGWAVFRVNIAKAYLSLAAPFASVDVVTDIDTLGDTDTLQGSLGQIDQTISTNQQAQALSAISFFKPARSVLDGLYFVEPPIIEPPISMSDFYTLSVGPIQVERPITITEISTVLAMLIRDTVVGQVKHDQRLRHAGGVTYSGLAPFISTGPIVVNGIVIAAV